MKPVIFFEKNTFIGDEKTGWKPIIQEICKAIERVNKKGDLFPAFEKLVKEIKYPFNDATELIARKEFNYFKLLLFKKATRHRNARRSTTHEKILIVIPINHMPECNTYDLQFIRSYWFQP